MGSAGRFDTGIDAWMSGLGSRRDVVRQELVRRQLAYHVDAEPGPLRVLDAGCGQGTQALALARAGHDVTGLDGAERLLGEARRRRDDEPRDVRARLRFVEGDLLALDDGHHDSYDLVCCHGVAMYLPSLDGTVAALCGAARPGGLISLLTRNRAGIAMRAGMSGDWAAARSGFDARRYDNRVGVESVRADDPVEVQAGMYRHGAPVVAWYGVRLFTDHLEGPPPDDVTEMVAAEEEAGRRDPYRSVTALTHTIGRRTAPPAA